MKVIGMGERAHRCYLELPARGPFWRRNPLCVEGMVVQCSCGKMYVWKWHGYSEHWGWALYDEEKGY